MRAIHTLSSLDTEASGPSYTVPRLAGSLVASGCSSKIFTLGQTRIDAAYGVPIVRFSVDTAPLRLITKLGRSRRMREALLTDRTDIFHTHGLWMMPNVYPAEAASRLGKPFVLAPRGMLGQDALKYSERVKHLFWAVWQKRAAEAVSCFHATAESEYEDIRAFGLTQPVAIVPNGIDLPVLSELKSRDASQLLKTEAPFILSLGRIHPKKGLDRLIAAFAQVAPEYPDWELKIVGPDEGGHASQLSRQAATVGLENRIRISPPVFGREKFLLMRQAEIFALSTLHENFGMTVAESLAVETPVVATRGAPWAELEVHGCGLWVEHGPAPMAKALQKLMSLPREERQKMGVRGRAWMQRDFGWDGIAAKMFNVYSWQLGHQEQPEWVWD